MRRPITCFILSALVLASCGAISDSPPLRTIGVKALADPSFRARNPNWTEEVRGRIEAASDYFEREFDIRLVTQSVEAWPAQDRVPSTLELIARLKKEFPREKSAGYDLIVAFTAEHTSRYIPDGRPRVDHIGDCRHGLGNYVVTAAADEAFRYAGVHTDLDYDTVSLIHELGHIFGAEHVQDPDSIMNENFDYRADFDMKNRKIILQNRNCPFAK